ncbi:MAG: contractile injection system protein, VgrG/Pvc8 family [Paludibacter sp.]|nr:contractile injection system protein, VgrG/Pvc8 family [Paludibacter sp.]
MSDRTLARRTAVKLYFKGKDISKDLTKYLLSLSFTDKEEDETDDISISLDDREGKWIKDWLNTSAETKTETVVSDIKVGNIVQFKGGPVYISATAAEPTITRAASKCKCTAIKQKAHPYHLISQDGKKVYGWVNASDVEGQTVTTTKTVKSQEKKAFKGTEIHAMVIQKNPYTNGKDKVLDCGVFEIDSVDYSGPPQKLNIKATSIPYKAELRQTVHNRVWENTTLKNMAEKIAKRSSFKIMYLSNSNPVYKRKEQVNMTDIAFLKKMCKKAGISLKVTSKTIVLFDAADYENKAEVKKIKAGKGNILSYSFSTKTADTSYSSCHVIYTDPDTKETIEYTYTPDNANADGQKLEVKQKVTSLQEAQELARKSLRAKNKGETTAEFTLVGDVDYVAGITVRVYGYGEFNGKYIVEQATHSITGGYKVQIKLRSCLEGY